MSRNKIILDLWDYPILVFRTRLVFRTQLNVAIRGPMSTDSRIKKIGTIGFPHSIPNWNLKSIQNNSAVKRFSKPKIGHVLAGSDWTMKLIAILASLLVVQGDSIWWNRSVNTLSQQARYFAASYQGHSKSHLNDMIRFYITNNPRALHVIRRHQNVKRKSSKFRRSYN